MKRRIPRHFIVPVRSQCVVPLSLTWDLGTYGPYQILKIVYRGKSSIRYVRKP